MDSGKSELLFLLFFNLFVTTLGYNLTRGSCPEGHVSCERGLNWRSGEGSCLKISNVCDHHMDCTDGSDEKYCPGNFNFGKYGFAMYFIQGACTPNLVLCLKKQGKCINPSWICDNDNDCDDNISDKKFCPFNITSKFYEFEFSQSDCPQNHFLCKSRSPKNKSSNHNCFHKSLICNSNEDCYDGSDELHCPYFFDFPFESSHTFTQDGCPTNYYNCKRGKPKHTNNPSSNCIMKNWICDGTQDCLDGSDEKYCPYYFDGTPTTPSTQPTSTQKPTTQITSTKTATTQKIIESTLDSIVEEIIQPNTGPINNELMQPSLKPDENQQTYPIASHIYFIILIILLVVIILLKTYNIFYRNRGFKYMNENRYNLTTLT